MKLWGRKHTDRSATTKTAKLNLEPMESRAVPASLAPPDAVALTYNSPAGGIVQIVNPNGSTQRTFQPFPGLPNAVTAATGDVNHDGAADVIVGVQNASGFVAVFDGKTGGQISSKAILPGYAGTISVGSADVDGDKYADVIVGLNIPGAPVVAYSGRDGGMLTAFLATPGFSAQLSLSGADFDKDGRDEIIVGAGGLGAALIYRADGSLATSAFPFLGFGGALSVAGGDVTGDGVPEIIVGGGAGASAGLLAVLDASGNTKMVLTPTSAGYRGGVVVGVGDADGDGRRDILVGLANGQIPGIWPFDGVTGKLLNYTPDTSTPVEL